MEQSAKLKGTLILGILCENGILICADKGLVVSDGSGKPRIISRNEKKLFRLTPNVIFTACGTIKLVDPNSSLETFNVIKLVQEFFANQEFEDTEAFWEPLKSQLKETFIHNVIVGKEIDDWPEEEPDEDKILIRLIFFFMDKERRVHLVELYLRYARQIPVDVSIQKVKSWFGGLLYAEGHTTLLRQVRDRDKSVQDLGSHPLVKLFLTGRTDPNTIKRTHAEDFCRIIMTASSERLSESWVSSEFDCELLNGHIRFSPLDKPPTTKPKKIPKHKKRRR